MINLQAQRQLYPTAVTEFATRMQGATPEAQEKLLAATDPYPWVAKLRTPKLVIQGSSDELFVTGASRFYFNDLADPKWMLNLPNGTHSGRGDRGEMANPAAIAAAKAFIKSVAANRPLPQPSWKFEDGENQVTVKFQCAVQAKQALLWSADSASQDFRNRPWTSRPLPQDTSSREAGSFHGEIVRPTKGFVAAFVSAAFEHDGESYDLSSLIHVAGQK